MGKPVHLLGILALAIIGTAFSGVVSDAQDGFTVPSLAAAGGLVLAAWLARR
jgi:hypothetical protein